MKNQPHSRAARSLTQCLIVAALGGLFAAAPGCQSLDNYFAKKRDRSGTTTATAANNGRPPAITDIASASVMRAQTFENQGNYEQALAEFEKAIATNPRMTVAYLGAGDIYRQKGDYQTAEQRYGAAAQIEPKNFDAQYLHGLALQMLDRVSEAVRAYLRALTIRPEDFNANLNLGTAYLQLNEPREALPYAERAVKLNGKNGPARTNLGAIYASLGRHEDAITEFQQAAELTELSGPLLLNLAESLNKTHRYEEMVNTLEQLEKSEPSAISSERLGVGYFNLRRYDDALAAFRKSLDRDPNHYPALNGVGVCLLNQWVFSQQRDSAAHEEALRCLRRSLQIERDQPQILELVSRYK
jgi:tetratricopeptide (TPR) repeat protein